MSFKKKIFSLIFVIFISLSLEKKNLILLEEDEDQKEDNIEPPKFSAISGFYPNNFKLKLSSEENYKIYYTLDSSDPRNSTSSKEFKDFIQIYDRSSEPNVYSAIGVNVSSAVSISSQSGQFQRYKVPFYPVDKAMIIRAVAKNSNGDFSEVVTKTYFVTTEDLYKYQDLTVVSLVTDPKNLFDPDIGIYVTGNKYLEEIKKNEGQGGNNFWRRPQGNFQMKGKEWERESFVTIFDKGEIDLQQKVGLRIKGAFTRTYPGKSFNLYARKEYGKSRMETNILKDNYDINGNLITSYKSLSLRNVYDGDRIRDEYEKDLYKREGLAMPNMRNSVLFLNGEFWGFYLIEEKIDNAFISQNYLIPSDSIVVVKANEVEDGPEELYNEFNYFCGNYSIKDVKEEEIYSQIKEKIDIDSFLELYATSIYIVHFDWPGNNEGQWKYFGEPIEGNKFSNGKWRFILYDLDYSMGADFFTPGSPEINMFSYIGGEGRMGRRRPLPSVQLFLSLLKNNSNFQHKFVNTICDYANEIYDIEKIDSLIERYKDECGDMMANTQLRWSGESYYSVFEGFSKFRTEYFKTLDTLRNFFENRAKFMYEHMKNYIGLKGEPVDLTIEIIGRGKVQVNSIVPKFRDGKWTGKYFSRIPITINAIPDEGFNFKEWTGDFQSTEQNEEIILFGNEIITVIFD